MTIVLVLALIAVLVVAAFFGWRYLQRRRSGARTFEGTFTLGWEVSSFVPGPPGSAGPRYWTAWTPESRFIESFREQGYDPAWTAGHGSVRARVSGILETGSEHGYGHMGQYTGQLTVQKVLSMTRLEPGG